MMDKRRPPRIDPTAQAPDQDDDYGDETDNGEPTRSEPNLSAVMAAMERKRSTAIEKPPKSLPVLAAFQEFLEIERKRSRNRMIIMGSFFGLVLLFLIVCGGLVGVLLYSRMQADYRDMERSFRDLQKETAERKSDVGSALAAFQGRTDERLKMLLDSQQQVLVATKAELSQQLEQQLAQVKAAVTPPPAPAPAPTPPPAAVSPELKDVKRAMQSLEAENARLHKDMGDLKAGLPRMETMLAELKELQQRPITVQPQPVPAAPTPALAAVPAPAAPVAETIAPDAVPRPPVVTETPPATAPVTVAKAPAAPPLPTTLTGSIKPDGAKRPVQWRFPTPE